MTIASVAAPKVKQDILELLLPRLPKVEGSLEIYETQEELDASIAPMKAKFDEIRSRYAPGTLMIIDARAIAMMRHGFRGHPYGTDAGIVRERQSDRVGGFVSADTTNKA